MLNEDIKSINIMSYELIQCPTPVISNTRAQALAVVGQNPTTVKPQRQRHKIGKGGNSTASTPESPITGQAEAELLKAWSSCGIS